MQYEWRFGALVRLVKLWARNCGINDSANGTLNSFAITLLVGSWAHEAGLCRPAGTPWCTRSGC